MELLNAMTKEDETIPEESEQAQHHINKARNARVVGNNKTALAHLHAAWEKMDEAAKKELQKKSR